MTTLTSNSLNCSNSLNVRLWSKCALQEGSHLGSFSYCNNIIGSCPLVDGHISSCSLRIGIYSSSFEGHGCSISSTIDCIANTFVSSNNDSNLVYLN